MKRDKIIVLLLIIILGLAWLVFSPKSSENYIVSENYSSLGLSVTSDITCTYPQTLYSSYAGGEITHELPAPETNPIIITFSDFDTEVSKAKFIDATQTISETLLVKIIDTPEKFVFLEGTGDFYITVHTIYKENGVATLAKSASLLGMPVGSMAMGTCVDS